MFLYLVYADAVTTPFVYHDQTRYFKEDSQDPHFRQKLMPLRGEPIWVYNSTAFLSTMKPYEDPPVESNENNGVRWRYVTNDHISNFLRMLGRPVTALIEFEVFKRFDDVSVASVVRLISISLYAASLALIAYMMIPLAGNRWSAFMLSASIFVLPSPLSTLFQGGLTNSLPVLLGVLSYIALPDFTRIQSESILYKVHTMLLRTARVILALCLFVVAMYTYPMYAYIFFILTLIYVLATNADDWAKARVRMLRDFVFVGMASVTYLITSRMIYGESLKALPPPYRAEISHDIMERLTFFIKGVSPLFFNLWNLYVKASVSNAVIAFIFSGVVAAAIVLVSAMKKSEKPRRLAQIGLEKFVFVVAIFFAASSPYIVSTSNLVLWRIFLPAAGMAVILLWWAVGSWARLLLRRKADYVVRVMVVITFLMFATGAVSANYYMSRNVWNTSVEKAYLEARLAGILKSNPPIARIHIIRPVDDSVGYNGMIGITDEFNRRSTEFTQDITDWLRSAMVEVADHNTFILQRCDLDQVQCVKDFLENKPPGILITHGPAGEPLYETPDTVVIDMNDLALGLGRSDAKVNMTRLRAPK